MCETVVKNILWSKPICLSISVKGKHVYRQRVGQDADFLPAQAGGLMPSESRNQRYFSPFKPPTMGASCPYFVPFDTPRSTQIIGHTRLVKKRRSKSLHGSSMVDMILSENMVHSEISFSLRLHFWGRAPFSETPIKIQEVGLVLLAALSWCKIQNWT